jgi:hypothetical protein
MKRDKRREEEKGVNKRDTERGRTMLAIRNKECMVGMSAYLPYSH